MDQYAYQYKIYKVLLAVARNLNFSIRGGETERQREQAVGYKKAVFGLLLKVLI